MTQAEWRLKFAAEKLIEFAKNYDETLRGTQKQLQDLKLRDLAQDYFKSYNAVWSSRRT